MSTKPKLLLTGGTGSLGMKFIEMYQNIYQIVVFSRDEFKQYALKITYPDLTFILGCVRDYRKVRIAVEGCKYVVHAAALKHITFGESHPEEFIKTNIIGTINVVEAAKSEGIDKFVFTSTDKAVEPLNLYGATKLCAEKVVLNAGYKVVRYGNVFASRGSVVPHFLKQKDTGELHLNDPDMTRFTITIEEAARFVKNALDGFHRLYIPRLKAYVLKDLATAIGPECKQIVHGLVAGEKIHEKLDMDYSSKDAIKLTVDEIKKLIHDTLQ